MPRGGTKRVIVAIVSALVLVTALASASPAAAEDFLSGYVSNEDSPSLTKFNTTTNEFDETLEDQLGEPGPIAVTADGTKAYVGESCNLIEPNDGTLTEVPTSQPGFFKIKITNEGCVSQIAISTKADVGDTGETVWAVIGDGAYPVDSHDESVGTPISPPEECRSGCVGEQVIQSVNDIALSPNGETLYMLYTNETIREGGNGEILETDADKLLAFTSAAAPRCRWANRCRSNWRKACRSRSPPTATRRSSPAAAARCSRSAPIRSPSSPSNQRRSSNMSSCSS